MLFSALLIFAAAVNGPAAAAPDEARVPGIIEFGAESRGDVLTVPATAVVGQDFDVRIVTFGGGCEREGASHVVVSKEGANIVVYDITAATGPGVACAPILKRLAHTVTLRFETAGRARIRVWGRRLGADTPDFGSPAVIERAVWVRTHP